MLVLVVDYVKTGLDARYERLEGSHACIGILHLRQVKQAQHGAGLVSPAAS